MRRPRLRSLAGGAAGIAAGVIGGVVLTSVSAAVPTPVAGGPAVIDATHMPPALTLPGEPVQLRYGLVCTPRDDGLPCDGSGTVYIRSGTSGTFRPYELRRDDDSKEGRYYVDVPPFPEGFSYYAVLLDDASGATVTVPTGGAAAPEVSLPLRDPVDVDLGRHVFGNGREASARVVDAKWGEVGRAGSRELGFSGPSSFDVEPDGTIDLLDSVNARVIRYAHGRRTVVPLAGDTELADFAAEPDGSFELLDQHRTLTRFRADGTREWAQKLADRTWAKLGHGAEVLQEPSEQWMPVAENGMPLARGEQARRGRADKAGIVVDRVGEDELRIAAGRAAWRITSETPLGEVQLAEAHGNGIAVVTHTYTDDNDEFVVLVLDAHGLAQRFSIASDSLTETAPLARFRLARGALYRLHTTDDGAVVDRFDLEVPQ